MLYFDLETTNLDYGSALNPNNRIVMLAWAVDQGPVRTHKGCLLDAKDFWTDLNLEAANAGTVCAYNCKFEQHWLKRFGFDIDSVQWHDPMLAEKVLLGNTTKPMGLGMVCERYGLDIKDPMIDALMKAGVCPSEMPQERLMLRCARDVRTARELLRKQMYQLRGKEQLHIYRTRCEFSTILTHIEANGMLLDARAVDRHYAAYSLRTTEVKKKLDAITGGINMRSSDQVAEFLYEKLKFPEKRAGKRIIHNKPSKRWPGGKPLTDQQTMSWLEGQAKTDEQKEFIALRQEFSKTNAALTKNLQFFKGVCDERQSKFYAQFNQTVAATHRLTSSGIPLQFKGHDKPKSVQFQNMPREFKECFTAPEGYLIAEVDGMQLEFRVAAYAGNDKQALLDIADPDFDAHCITASEMFDIPYKQFLDEYRSGMLIRKLQRTQAKPDTFKPLYGGTRGTPEQEKYYKAFAKRYAGVAATQENWLAEVMATGELKTPWGMRFRWDTYMSSKGVAMDKRTKKPVGPQVANYPIQNLATAEIIPIAIIALYNRCKELELDVQFVNTVHDSVICFVKDDTMTLNAFRQSAELAFTTDVYERLTYIYGIDFSVPLGMEMVIGKHWGNGKEFKYDDVNNRRKA